MRILSTSLLVLSFLGAAGAASVGCAAPSQNTFEHDKAATDKTGATTTTATDAAAALTVNGQLSNAGSGTTAQGLGGSQLTTEAKTVDVTALGTDGTQTTVGTANVQPGGAFTTTVPADASPTGIFILKVKNLGGDIIGSGVINGIPAFLKGFTVQATVDTATSFKAEILGTIAKGGVPGVQSYLNVIDAYVNAQYANSVAVVSVVATDLTTIISATSDAIIAAQNVIVSELQKAGIPIDLSALQSAQLATVGGIDGQVTSASNKLISGGKNLVDSLEAASAKSAAPIDTAIFNAVVNGSAAFSGSMKKSTPATTLAGGPTVTFAASKSAFSLQSALSTSQITNAFAQNGASDKVINAVSTACAAFMQAGESATSTADLETAKSQFTSALTGKGGSATGANAGGVMGLLTTAIAELTALWNSIDTTLAPLANELETACASYDPDQIAAALGKFDVADLAKKLESALSPQDASTLSNALNLVQKQVAQ